MPAFPREELEEMMERWLEANRNAEREGDWSTYLGAHYTDDAIYRWNAGPNEEFWARGHQEIKEVALGYHMRGFEEWAYPYDTVLIDEKQGQIVGFWRQVAPFKRADGTDYEIAGVGRAHGSSTPVISSGAGSETSSTSEMRNRSFSSLRAPGTSIRRCVRRFTVRPKERCFPGHEPLRKEPGKLEKLRNFQALVRIALFG